MACPATFAEIAVTRRTLPSSPFSDPRPPRRTSVQARCQGDGRGSGQPGFLRQISQRGVALMSSTRRDGYSALPREPRGTGGLRWELLRVPWRKGRWKQGTGTGVGNVDKNVTSTPFFESASGEKITETGEAGAGDDG